MFCPPQARLRRRAGDGFAALSGCQGASIAAVPYPLTSPPSRSSSPPGKQNMISGSETSSPSSFPLGRTVAFRGSRHGSPFPISLVVAAVLSAGGVLGPGSSLALRCALSAGLPVWCAGPRPSVPASCSSLRLAGVPGFICLRSSIWERLTTGREKLPGSASEAENRITMRDRIRRRSLSTLPFSPSAITLEDVAGWFTHCGYYPQDQCS
jgi:hypothetical protein